LLSERDTGLEPATFSLGNVTGYSELLAKYHDYRMLTVTTRHQTTPIVTSNQALFQARHIPNRHIVTVSLSPNNGRDVSMMDSPDRFEPCQSGPVR
jgi:hypothetical protein